MEMAAPHSESSAKNSPDTVPGAVPERQDGNHLSDPAQRQPNPDAAYRWLLMANPKGEIAAFLAQAAEGAGTIDKPGTDI